MGKHETKQNPFKWIWEVDMDDEGGVEVTLLETLYDDSLKQAGINTIAQFTPYEAYRLAKKYGSTNTFEHVNHEGFVAKEITRLEKEIEDEIIAKANSQKRRTSYGDGLLLNDDLNPKFAARVIEIAKYRALLKIFARVAFNNPYNKFYMEKGSFIAQV